MISGKMSAQLNLDQITQCGTVYHEKQDLHVNIRHKRTTKDEQTQLSYRAYYTDIQQVG